jgi:archaetidylinositol phosphate synthase
MNPTSFRPAARQQESLLSPIEKRTLLYLARRMPAWVHSDHLTALGFLGMAGAGIAYYLSTYHPLALLAASACLVVNWFGDSLDGTLARVRRQERPRYGFYVDHVVDAFAMLFLIGGMGLSGYMSPAIAMALLIAYFMLSIELYLATYTLGLFRLSFGPWGPTELRAVVIAGNAVLLVNPQVTLAGNEYLLCDVAGVVTILALAVIVISSAIRNGRRLYLQETVR